MRYSVESDLIHSTRGQSTESPRVVDRVADDNERLKMCNVVAVCDNLHVRLGQGGMRVCGEAGEAEFDSVVYG